MKKIIIIVLISLEHKTTFTIRTQTSEIMDDSPFLANLKKIMQSTLQFDLDMRVHISTKITADINGQFSMFECIHIYMYICILSPLLLQFNMYADCTQFVFLLKKRP